MNWILILVPLGTVFANPVTNYPLLVILFPLDVYILSHVCFITTVFVKHQLNKEYALYRIISCIWDGHMLQCSELHRDILPAAYNYVSWFQLLVTCLLWI